MQVTFVFVPFCCTVMIIQESKGINLIDISEVDREAEEATTTTTTVTSWTTRETEEYTKAYPPIRSTGTAHKRRFMIVSASPVFRQDDKVENEKDKSLKNKIAMLVQQAIHDSKMKMKTIEALKDKYKDDSAYKVGFIFNNLKKSRDVMNELFNVAVKHRHDWKALEQMKIFELIVHTNVDTTNFVRQLIELHFQATNSTTHRDRYRKRVVLL